MNWKERLDKYLTTPPEDGFDDWSSEVDNNLSECFWDTYGHEFMFEDKATDWLTNLYYVREKTPQEAAKIVERAFFINKLNK